jgi:flagellar basal-body rod protein FlgF
MQSNFYVGLSAQISLQRRLETIANNVANASTAGFRAEEVKCESVLSRTSVDPVAMPLAVLSLPQVGRIRQDRQPFDVAVQGDAWLAVQTPNGTAYTRDGRLRMTETGELMSLSNQPVLDAGGAPLRLDPNAGPPRISSDGTITQNNRQIGALGLFQIDAKANLTRVENSGVVPDRPATPALDFAKIGVHQGYQRANVNPVPR